MKTDQKQRKKKTHKQEFYIATALGVYGSCMMQKLFGPEDKKYS